MVLYVYLVENEACGMCLRSNLCEVLDSQSFFLPKSNPKIMASELSCDNDVNVISQPTTAVIDIENGVITQDIQQKVI